MADQLVVITGASGNQCSHVIPHLYEHPSIRLRLVVNSENSLKRLSKQYPSAEVIRADFGNPNDCSSFLRNATSVMHLCPGFHPREAEVGYNMIDAAVAESKTGRLNHFVYSGVINSQIRKLLNHDVKRYVEEYLIESGLPYTILQPTHFMGLLPVGMLMKQEQPVFNPAWDPAVLFSFLAYADLGEAAANVLKEGRKHHFTQYQLCSTGPQSYNEVIAILSEVMGKEVKIQQASFEEGFKNFLTRRYGSGDVPPKAKDGAERLLLYYNRRGLIGNPSVLEMVLGRKATTYEQWIRKEVQKLKDSS